MPVQLTPDVHWINICEESENDDTHVHNSVYLITGDSNILIDSGSYIDRDEIRAAVSQLTEGEGIDALLVSHSDAPHTGNAKKFAEDWDVEIHSSVSIPEAQGLFPWGDGNRKLMMRMDHDVVGRRFHASELVLVDRPSSVGLFDYESGVFFTADGFGNYHRPWECDRMFDDLEDDIVPNMIRYYREKLPWLRYVDAAKTREEIANVLSEFDISYIAPIHGNPVPAESLEAYLNAFEDVAQDIYDHYDEPGTTHPSLRTDHIG
jgi:flavorubredoxin